MPISFLLLCTPLVKKITEPDEKMDHLTSWMIVAPIDEFTNINRDDALSALDGFIN